MKKPAVTLPHVADMLPTIQFLHTDYFPTSGPVGTTVVLKLGTTTASLPKPLSVTYNDKRLADESVQAGLDTLRIGVRGIAAVHGSVGRTVLGRIHRHPRIERTAGDVSRHGDPGVVRCLLRVLGDATILGQHRRWNIDGGASTIRIIGIAAGFAIVGLAIGGPTTLGPNRVQGPYLCPGAGIRVAATIKALILSRRNRNPKWRWPAGTPPQLPLDG